MKPIFIERTTPGEFESMPLSLFTADLAQEHYEETGVKLFSSLGHPDIGYRSEVCLELEPGGLAQVGDDFSEFETFVARTTLSVDNIVLTEVEGGHINLTATNVVDKKGEILIRGVGSAFICGQVVLDAGLHNVRFEFEQTSGDIQTYTWQFELTEE